MDRFAVLPRNLLRYVAETLQAPPLTIASLRSLYECRPTLYEHQQWARDYLGLRDLDPRAEGALVSMLARHAAEAAHADELVTSACHWLYDHRAFARQSSAARMASSRLALSRMFVLQDRPATASAGRA